MMTAIRLKPGPGSSLKSPGRSFASRIVELKPDICSLDMGSLNMGDRVFVDTPSHLQAMAEAIKTAGVMPELEVFETGHLLLAKRFLEQGYVKPPGMFQICLGISWGQPATPEAMTYMRNLLPPNSPWFAFGISLHQFPMVAQTVLLGGHPRVGLEDNIYLEKGKLAPSNAALVEKAAKIIAILGDHVATPGEARQILGLASSQLIARSAFPPHPAHSTADRNVHDNSRRRRRSKPLACAQRRRLSASPPRHEGRRTCRPAGFRTQALSPSAPPRSATRRSSPTTTPCSRRCVPILSSHLGDTARWRRSRTI